MNLATSVPTVPGVKVVESEGDESEEEESEILEESPCGRWLKRREEVAQPVQDHSNFCIDPAGGKPCVIL